MKMVLERIKFLFRNLLVEKIIFLEHFSIGQKKKNET
jgi:hypothetical protein